MPASRLASRIPSNTYSGITLVQPSSAPQAPIRSTPPYVHLNGQSNGFTQTHRPIEMQPPFVSHAHCTPIRPTQHVYTEEPSYHSNSTPYNTQAEPYISPLDLRRPSFSTPIYRKTSYNTITPRLESSVDRRPSYSGPFYREISYSTPNYN